MGTMIPRRAFRFILAAVLAAGCGGQEQPAPPPASGGTGAAPAPVAAAQPDAGPPTIVFVGTSLTAGYGLPDPALAYPALIQHKIDSLGLQYRVINAGVSGETSAGALRRIDWVLQQGRVAVLMVETGANDGLRGQDPDSTAANIQAIFDRARALTPPPRLVLTGMEAMPNLGNRYVERFRGIYPALARANDAAFVPFLLEGVAGVDSLNQADGIHPTARGQQIVAGNVWRVLRDVIAAP